MFVERLDVNSVLEGPQEPNSCQKLLNDSSTEKHDDHAQVDINSLDLSSIKTCQKKKKKKKRARKKRKSSACSIVSLGSIEEGPLSSVLAVHDRSVTEISSNISGKAGDGSSVLAGGEISLRKVSGESANGEPLSGRKKKKKRKKKRKLTACPITTLGSTEEGGSPSVLVVPNGSVGEITLNQSVEVREPCNSAKLREEVIAGNNTSVVTGGKISQEIAGNGTSVRIGGKISQEMASHVCPNGESEFEKRKEKSKMGNLEENDTRHGGVHRRKKRKSSACPISSLESIEKGVKESSAGSICVNHLDEAPESSYSGKMMEVVVGLQTSQEKASGECSYGETASGNERKKSKMENMEESNMGNCVGKDASLVDIPETDFEQGNKDMDHMVDVIQNAVLSKEDKASDDVRGSVPSVDDIEVDNVGVQPMLSGVIPSSSELRVMMNSVTLESPKSSEGGAPHGHLKKKILVLDVNGLLAAIVPSGTGGYQPHKVLSQKAVFKRPFCDDFLQFCFERFHVGVWSSRNRKNVNSVLDFLMGKSKCNLLFCWDQSHCTNTGYNTVENREKPLLLKELKRLWDKHEPDFPWACGEYNESNTLLLDDSPYKALRNPPHTAIFPHSYCYKDQNDNSLGPGGNLRVYLEGLALADNVQKYVEQNPFGQRPISNTNLSWRFYLKIIGNPSSQGEEDATNDSSDCQQREEDAANNSLLCQQRS